MLPASSTLDRQHAALAIVDIQDRLAQAMDRRSAVVAKAVLLCRAAAIVGLPLISTRQYPKGLGDLDGSVARALEDAEKFTSVVRVDKMSFDCFAEPSFADAVARAGRRQLLICGMETHICVAQTALSAIREGFDVHVAADACCSIDEESRVSALTRLGNAGAVVTTAESAAYEIVGKAGTEEFKQLLEAVKQSVQAG